MKVKFFLSTMLIALFVTIANAQPPNGQMPRMNPEDMANRQTEQMVTDLKLNDKQKTEIKAINIKYAKKMSELFQANQGGDWEANRTKMQEMNTQKNAEFEKVLTADQYKLFTEQEKKRMEERRQRMGQNPRQGAPGQGQRGTPRGGGDN